MKFVSLLLAQLVLGLVNCQYGPTFQRDFIPQQQMGYGQQPTFRDIPIRVIPVTPEPTTTTLPPVLPPINSYGQQQQLTYTDDTYGYDDQQTQSYGQMPQISLDVQQTLTDPCAENPCMNMGTCVSSEDWSGFWCYCLDSTTGDLCETVLTTTTPTTTTTTTRRAFIKAPIRQPVQPTYGQQQPLVLDTVTPAPIVPQYNRVPFRQSQPSYGQQIIMDIPTTTTTTPKPFLPPFQPTYGQQQQLILDTVTPAPFVPQYNRVPVRQPIVMDLPTTTTTTPTPFFPPVQPSYGTMPQLDLPVVPTTSGCTQTTCLNEGTCNGLPNGQWFCTCPWGYTGLRCEECLTDCKTNPCPANKVCQARYGGGYDCVCPTSRTGFNCEIQNDACSTNQCLNGGLCLASTTETAGFSCQCREGFAGQRCETRWQNPCSEDTLRQPYMMQFEAPWNTTSYILCIDVNTWIEMPCAIGTLFSKRLGHCVGKDYKEPSCPQGYCFNDAECVLDRTGRLTCDCKEGYMGDRCEIDVDDCAKNGNPCAGGMCVDQINTYYCICPSGVGLDCVNTIPDPCTSDSLDPEQAYFTIPSLNHDHFLHCEVGGSWKVRKCAAGLFWNQDERTCTMEKPKLKSGACLTYPCSNGGQCQDVGYNQYSCLCKDGYTGAHCEIEIDYCESNPCKNGGRCLKYTGGYTCVCQDKVIDECCCNGVLNPCADKSSVYYPHVLPNRYIHCDADGRAFVRTCPTTTRWMQSMLSCLSEDIISANTTPVPTVPQFVAPQRDLMPTVQTYGQQLPVVQPLPQQPTVVRQPMQTVQTVQQPSYGQQMPELSRDLPQEVPVVPTTQTGYGSMTPTETFKTTGRVVSVQQQVPVARVPVQQQGRNVPVQQPVQQQFGQARVVPVQQQQQFGRIVVPQLEQPIDLSQPVQQVNGQQRGRFVQVRN